MNSTCTPNLHTAVGALLVTAVPPSRAGRTGDMSTHAVNQLASWMLEHPSIDDVTTISRSGAETSSAGAAGATAGTGATYAGAACALSAARGAEVRPAGGRIGGRRSGGVRIGGGMFGCQLMARVGRLGEVVSRMAVPADNNNT